MQCIVMYVCTYSKLVALKPIPAGSNWGYCIGQATYRRWTMDPGHTQNHVGVSDRRSNWAHEFQPTTCVRDKSSIGYDFQYVHNQSFFHWPVAAAAKSLCLDGVRCGFLKDWLIDLDTSQSFLRLVQVLFNDENHAKAMQSVRPWPGFQNLHCFHSNRSCFTAWFPEFGTLRHNDKCHRKQVFHRSPSRPTGAPTKIQRLSAWNTPIAYRCHDQPSWGRGGTPWTKMLSRLER